MKVAVIFHRLGPYHFARLRAAGQVLPVVAIETSGTDVTYAWDKITGAENFERVTLFADADAQKQPAAEVARRLVAVLEQTRPTVVAVPGWADASALVALQWCGRNRVPTIIMSESTAGDEARQPWKELIKRQVVALGSAALAGGTPHREYLVQLGLPAERIFLGYDAVDNDYFSAKAEESRKQKAESRKQAIEKQKAESGNQKAEGRGQKAEFQVSGFNVSALPSDEFQLSAFPISTFKNAPYFLASARFIEKKNLPRLIEAYAVYRKKAESGKQKAETEELRRADNGKQTIEKLKAESTSPRPSPQSGEGEAETLKPEMLKSGSVESSVANHSSLVTRHSEIWSLVLLGDGALRSSLESQIVSLALHDHVQMPGFIQYPELPAYYARAGAFIHASTSEQWGLVVNEAMASGLPVLVSHRCGCAADLVQGGVNGYTFDPYDVEQLAQLMLKISAFNFPLSTFGDASRKIIANWGPARFAAGLQAAAECAVAVGSPRATVMQRLILKMLLRR